VGLVGHRGILLAFGLLRGRHAADGNAARGKRNGREGTLAL
jgi:hypothetical protein